ncbi:MAG: KAP family NTPase [Candidatus Omnitrophica bacterium]|nr:KAP family NTPase [Candidatus Omnitrophota bacterium]
MGRDALLEKGKRIIRMKEKPKKAEELQPRFLPDVPLPADKEKDAVFGHGSIARNLAKIIQSCPAPFTIGLFGKWGTGKTTVINLLSSELESSKRPIRIARVDAWKYEEDSLRRQFLITLDNELQLGLQYQDKLNQTLTEADPTKGRITFDWGLLTRGTVAVSAGLVLIGFILQHLPAKYIPLFKAIVPSLSNVLISSGFLIFILNVLLGLVKRAGITITEHRTDSAEGFERKFTEDILKHKILRGKRLLIIVDNLDRCSHAKAVELLSTIKTFLAKDEPKGGDHSEQAECVFLITCDDQAIKQHIRSVYLKDHENNASGAFDVDEFLRKFFNAFVRIPSFIDTELQSYTEKLLDKTNVPQLKSKDLAYVITSSFRENPRQIKQFINTLLAHFLLAKEREEDAHPLMPPATVTGNVAFLAKLLIIRQHFPDVYREIEEKHLTVDELQDIGISDAEQLEEFRAFLRATKTITTTDIRPFIHLKQSEEELKIPAAKELELGLVDNKPESVSEKLKTIKANPSQLESLKRFIPDLIGRNAGRKQLLLNIVSCSLESLRQNNIQLGKEFYDKIGDLLVEEGELKGELQTIEPVLIFGEVLPRCDAKYKSVILKQYAELFAPQGQSPQRPPIDYATKLLDQFISHKEEIRHKLPEIRKAMVELYFAETKLLALLKDKADDQKDFLTEESPSKLAESLSDQDVENQESLKEKLDLYINFITVAKPAAADMFLKLATQLITNESQKPYRPAKEHLFSCVSDVLSTYENLIGQIADKSNLTKLSDASIQAFGRIGDWTQKRIAVPLLLTLARLDSARVGPLESNVQRFVGNTAVENIQHVLSNLNQEAQQAFIQRYESVLRPRVQQDPAFFEFIYEKAPVSIRMQWFGNLIASPNYARALKKLEDMKFKVDDPKAIVDKLLSYVQNVGENDKRVFYNAVNQMECANNADLKTLFCSQIRALLKEGNAQAQETGHLALKGAGYLSETHKRDTTRETVEWLKTLSPNNALHAHVHAIKSVMIGWAIVPEPVQRGYVDFVFDKLIRRSSSLDSIKLGFEILVEVTPTYESHKTYFDDLYTKIEGEGNAQIKAELIAGLMKLKPKEKGMADKEFWEKVEKLASSA